jgi:hypothetical protein
MAEIEEIPFSEERFIQSFRNWYREQTLADLLNAQRSSQRLPPVHSE